MSNEGDRRAPGATRIPFEALVEVSPSMGPAFEAQAVDVSDEGMHMRTAYLPDLGQPLMCRFDAGSAGTVSASGEVLWRQEGERGGEFGMRFVDLDAESADALGRIVRIAQPQGECDGAPAKVIQSSGSKVRLHIEGLGFPMRARVKDATRKELTVGNELGFLQVGKQLELEDAETGEKRPASIDRVEVEIDPESRVPRLVVGLRYDDEADSVPISPEQHEELHADAPKDSTPEPSVMDSEDDEEASAKPAAPEKKGATREVDEESNQLKSAFARNAAKVTPALVGFAKRARATAGVLMAKHKQRSAEAPQKRTTAPPPAGGLHAAGRKVVRAAELVAAPKTRLDTKRKVAIGAGAGLAVVLAFAAMHKSPKAQTAAQDKPVTTEATAAAAQPPPTLPEPAPLPVQTAPPPPQPVATAPAPQGDDSEEQHHAKRVHVAPFGNGGVAHGNVLRLKMDGTIENINGATQPDGFSVSIPGRRALEPAGPLASRDARLASIKVTNDQGGASLDVAFKDGVPKYLVRAKGDTLEIILAAPGKIGGEEKSPAPSHASAQAPRHHGHTKK